MTTATHEITGTWSPGDRDWIARCPHPECGHYGHCGSLAELATVTAMHDAANQGHLRTALPEVERAAADEGKAAAGCGGGRHG